MHSISNYIRPLATLTILLIFGCQSEKNYADIILLSGKIITMDKTLSIAEAIAITDGKLMAVGDDNDILRLRGDSTKVIKLQGHAVIPGLIENHAHPVSASVSEFSEKIPDVHTIRDLLQWIHTEAVKKEDNQWIIHPKLFVTRLGDMRQLTKQELDSVAPHNPVFLNGSYGGFINSKAFELSRITDTQHPGILRDKKTGDANGMIRQAAFHLLSIPPEKKLSDEERLTALQQLLQLYNKVGITSVCSGSGGQDELSMFKRLMDRDQLTVRVFQNFRIPFDTKASLEELMKTLKAYGYKTGHGNEWVKVGALKVVLDGGMLTGTAYLNEGWGPKAKEMFGINDPHYRGELFFSKKELVNIITAAFDAGWKFTAHVTGGGGVDTLLAAYEIVDSSRKINQKRFSIIHGNFYTKEAIRKMALMGIYADMQPAWFYKDTNALLRILGKQRMESFHPYRSMMEAGILINGGSDHMVKLDPVASINPYNPFLAMWSAITRKTDSHTVFNPGQSISRIQALQMYTINNAYASFEEDLKGSIEVGKFADLVVLSNDILTCPVDAIRSIKPILTLVNGKVVFDDGTLE
ncbi:MAG: amidohydrolase [Cyclobacteriaceae bacterium]